MRTVIAAQIVVLLIAGSPAPAEVLFEEARIGPDTTRAWTFALPDPRCPPVPSATVGTRKYLSVGNAADTYPDLGALQLCLRVRSDAAALAGMLPFMEVRVNGQRLTVAELIGRPARFRTQNGTVVAAAAKGTRFVVYHAPDFEALSTTYKYYPTDLPAHDPFTYAFRITAHSKTGPNVVEIRNTRVPPKQNTLVLEDARIEELLGDDMLADQAEMQAAEARRYRQAAAAISAIVPTIIDPPALREIIGAMRLTNWGAANSSPMTEYDLPAEAAANAARIRADGATAAIVRGRHFRLDHLGETERLMAFYKLTAKACHDHGLTPFAHLDFTLFWQPGYATIAEHPDWPQVALNDGTPHHWCCTNNPGFREAHIRYVEQICRQGMVGFMLDEINFAHKGKHYCGCVHCRRRFEEATGFRLSEHDDTEVIGNNRHALWRLWLEWQHASIARFKGELVQRLRRINPNAVVLTYSTNIYGPARAGNTFEEGRVCFSGTEGSNCVYAQFANLYADHRIADAFSRRWARPTWAQYPTGKEDERVWASAFFASVVNNKPWGWRRYHHGENMRDVLAWPHLTETMIFAEPVADLAVLLGTPNRWGPPLDGQVHAAETYGLCQALGLRGIQFDPVPSRHLRADELTRFRALLVGYAPAMPRSTVERVHAWVRAGGVAVVTGLAGRYDRFGFALGANSLIRQAGLRGVVARDNLVYHRYDGRLEAQRPRVIQLVNGTMPNLPRRLVLPPCYRFDAVPAAATAADVLATFADGKPAICSLPARKGRYIWVGFLPGAAIAQRRLHKKSVQTETLHPVGLDLIAALAQLATANTDTIRVNGQGVLGTAWRKGKRVWVRLVNVAGAMPQAGRTAGDVPVTYPPLDAIHVSTRLTVHDPVILLTPDVAAPIPLPVHGAPGGHTVKIPPGTFRRFAVVRMEVAP
ncbi:MAG: hypothetical protein HN742_03930 [Lentisphaerae bacterium]|nr:hypothetical protein [Lentisphaerota bacterium]MBT4820729.1 hypothetical protein [Lentisphaerota bacterium]MBT5604886.1 hypothetical protein [Lentisphaerota bacterium]MBT7054195.1 hypothetical protein [Lentisphaerota bacterium]MBT7840992.1 hypothetical protein [Lentisphaerota bacterium]